MYIMGIDPSRWDTDISAGGEGPQNALGALGANITDQGMKTYRYVKLRNETATVTVAAGDLLAFLGSPASDAEYNTVVSDNTDAATKPVCAGMADGDADGNFSVNGAAAASTIAGTLATAFYGWVQIGGHAVLNADIAGTTPADGDAIFLSTTDKTATLATAVDDPICAHIIDDSAQIVRLRCVL